MIALFENFATKTVKTFSAYCFIEVRWLSTGNCLKRFNDFYDTLLEFFNSNDVKSYNKLKGKKVDIAYLTDIFSKLYEVNIKLQNNDMNLIKAKVIINTCTSKLSFYKDDNLLVQVKTKVLLSTLGS